MIERTNFTLFLLSPALDYNALSWFPFFFWSSVSLLHFFLSFFLSFLFSGRPQTRAWLQMETRGSLSSTHQWYCSPPLHLFSALSSPRHIHGPVSLALFHFSPLDLRPSDILNIYWLICSLSIFSHWQIRSLHPDLIYFVLDKCLLMNEWMLRRISLSYRVK